MMLTILACLIKSKFLAANLSPIYSHGDKTILWCKVFTIWICSGTSSEEFGNVLGLEADDDLPTCSCKSSCLRDDSDDF